MCTQNLGTFGQTGPEIQNKGKLRVNFEPHLHNQDGVILIHCYFEICLHGQVLYVYKIWARLDKQFLRYKTKGKCVCVRARVCGF